MEKVPGTLLIDALPRMDERLCDETAAELRAYISDIRRLSSSDKWGVVGRGGVFHGGYFKYLRRPYTEEQFRSGNPCVASSTRDVLEYFAKACEDSEGRSHPEVDALFARIDLARPAVVSRSDLVPENIVVDEKTGAITAVFDWENAGWYPYLWDDRVAHIRKSTHQDRIRESALWDRIRKAAIERQSEEDAVAAFCELHFFAFMWGQDEYSHPPCCCLYKRHSSSAHANFVMYCDQWCSRATIQWVRRYTMEHEGMHT
ncbi:hypothetical protein GY45DRAFT_915888 [Cubamyces sp. BRFM 1775]|nr:hypothetical protein GY45DRAFT_915888 [Cubamyces sp. BRFM 1775]